MSLLIGPDTTFTRMGSVLANRAGYYIYLNGKGPCYYSRTLDSLGREVSQNSVERTRMMILVAGLG